MGRDNSCAVLQQCYAVDWRPQPIVAMSVCPDQSVLAVAREDASIEIWNGIFWLKILTIPGTSDGSITAMCWARDVLTSKWRLFTCGLDGLIAEWDLQKLVPISVTPSLGGAAWHMAARPHKLQIDSNTEPEEPVIAVATDDGAARLHSVEGSQPGLSFQKKVCASDARALQLAWDSSGEMLYVGFSDGCISVINVPEGRETMRITATSKGATLTCVWALVALPGGVASGSSSGHFQVFETQFGTQRTALQVHQADVTCMAASPSGKDVFAAGVDPTIVMFETENSAVGVEDNLRFQLAERKRPHTRDVKAMAVISPPCASKGESPEETKSWLVTGGNDAILMLHSADGFNKVPAPKLTAAPCAPLLAYSSSGRFISATSTSVDLWQPGEVYPDLGKVIDGKVVKFRQQPALILSLKTPVHLAAIAATVSPCGHLVAYSSTVCTKLFAVMVRKTKYTQATVSVAEVKTMKPLSPACALCFAPTKCSVESTGNISPVSCCLMLGCLDGRLLYVDVDIESATTLPEPVEIPLTEEHIMRKAAAIDNSSFDASQQLQLPFTKLEACGDGTTVAVLTSHSITILRSSKSGATRYSVHGQLPLSRSVHSRPVTALCLSMRGDILALSTIHEPLELYDCSRCLPLPWIDKCEGVEEKLKDLDGFVHSMSMWPCRSNQPSSLIMCSSSRMCSVSLDSLKSGVEVAIREKVRGMVKPAIENDAPSEPIRVIASKDTILGASCAADKSILLIEGKWERAVESLPPPLMLKVFH